MAHNAICTNEINFYLFPTAILTSLMAAMGQVLRITYNNFDYSFQILNQRPVSRETEEIQILLNGITQTLVCRGRQWLAKEQSALPDLNLIDAIGKAIALRYRI